VTAIVLAGASPAWARQAAQDDATRALVLRSFDSIAADPAPAPPPRGDMEMLFAPLAALHFGFLFGPLSTTAFTVGGDIEAPMTAVLINGTRTNFAGQVSWAHVEGENLLSFLGGITLRPEDVANKKYVPFGRVLGGFARSFGSSAFELQFGGGVDIPWKPNMMVRIQGEIPIFFAEGGSDSGFRLTGGITIPLKRQ
jgi:hypothetical protein